MLVVDVSGHGLGHASQIAPVVRALHRDYPQVRIIVRSDLLLNHIRNSMGPVSGVAAAAPETGLVMKGPHLADLDATLAHYCQLHGELDRLAHEQSLVLRRLGAAALLSDVPYSGLLGASHLGIPCVCLGSLHWGEVVSAYFGATSDGKRIAGEICRAYNLARAFLLVGPRKTAPCLTNVEPVAPLVRSWGRRRVDDICFRAGVSARQRIGLVSFGGITRGEPDVSLPSWPGWLWVVSSRSRRRIVSSSMPPSIAEMQDLDGIDFLDLVASSSLVVTKTGYSTFLECAHYGVPCVFLPRPDWPEADELETWMIGQGFGRSTSLADLANGSWQEQAEALLSSSRPRLRDPGAKAVTHRIAELLALGS